MLPDTDKDLVRQCMDPLRDGIAGLRTRRLQLEMVAAVANTLLCCRQEPDGGRSDRGAHIAVIEVGTGTGKSFGALVPALVMARTLGKRLQIYRERGDSEIRIKELKHVLVMDRTSARASWPISSASCSPPPPS